MTAHTTTGRQSTAWVGTKVTSAELMPGTGTWEIIDHPGCEADGLLRAYPKGTTAPRCPVCGADIRWQLTHMSPTVAADHRGAGRLP